MLPFIKSSPPLPFLCFFFYNDGPALVLTGSNHRSADLPPHYKGSLLWLTMINRWESKLWYNRYKFPDWGGVVCGLDTKLTLDCLVRG